MAENYTISTAVDPNSRVTETSASRIDFTGITRNESAYNYWNKGANFYAGNFKFDVDVNATSGHTSLAIAYAIGLSNSINDFKTILSASGNVQCIEIQIGTSSFNLAVAEYSGGTRYASSHTGLSLSTTYYLTLRRDESVGTYGTLYMDIYSDSARTSLIVTKSLTLHANIDFQYLYGFNTYNDGQTYAGTGYLQNLIDYQSIYVTETGTGTDTVSVAQIGNTVTITDTGTGADSVASVTATLTVTDTGSGLDAILAYNGQLVSVADTGAGADTLASILVTLGITETGSGADSINVSGGTATTIILESTPLWPQGQAAEYQIVDEYRAIIQSWTTTGVFEVAVMNKSVYSVKIGQLSQYTIMWRIPSTRYEASRTVDIFETNNDVAASSRLASVDYTAPETKRIYTE